MIDTLIYSLVYLLFLLLLRQTQWDMPSFDETEPESLSGELDTPSAIVEEHHRKVGAIYLVPATSSQMYLPSFTKET